MKAFNAATDQQTVDEIKRRFAETYTIDCLKPDEKVFELSQEFEGAELLAALLEYESDSPPGIVSYNGELVIDIGRGVVYFHDEAVGITRLRICGLSKSRLNKIADESGGFLPELFAIDITKPERVAITQ